MSKKPLVILSILAVATLFSAGYHYYYSSKNASTSLIAHGFVDVKEASLGFERAGKINNIEVAEGQLVKAQDVLARLDTQDLDHQLAIKDKQCQNLKVQYEELESGYRSQEIKAAKAQVTSLEHSYDLAKRSCARLSTLFERKAASLQDKDDACIGAQVTYSNLEAARANLALLQEGYRQEQIKARFLSYQTCLQESEYLNYQKEVQSVLKAPFAGVIRASNHEIGDYLSPGAVVFELSKVTPKEVRVYVTEENLASVKVGHKALVESLSASLEGEVVAISESAMFTPKTVQTQDLRPSLVFEVKILVPDTKRQLRLGQAVSARFL